jgi:2-oxoisovalerate dehydrogenase E1 component
VVEGDRFEEHAHGAVDGGWLEPYPSPVWWGSGHVPVGRPRRYGAGTDAVVVAWANGLRLALRAQRRLAAEGIHVTVLDLRWLSPLPVDELVAEARRTGRVLVVDETRRSGGVGEGVLAALVEGGCTGPMARVAAHDTFVPLGEAAWTVLVREDDVLTAARELVRRPR